MMMMTTRSSMSVKPSSSARSDRTPFHQSLSLGEVRRAPDRIRPGPSEGVRIYGSLPPSKAYAAGQLVVATGCMPPLSLS